MDASLLIDGLRSPAAYPVACESVELRQTHISYLFFAGERVYKVKKPVALGFLDFTDLDARRRFCEEEVRLNQRLAPDVHLGVAPIVRGPDGALRVAGRGAPEGLREGEVVEWAVEMRRLPSERMLDALLAAGEIDNDSIGRLAALLADFHARARADAEVAAHGTPTAVARNVQENFSETEPFTVGPLRALTPELHAFLAGRARRFLDEHEELLARRAREGRVREGHGDLHAENICFEQDAIVVYDCIEFSDRFRCCDVAADLAFLVMDLDLRGFPAFGRFLVRRYRELSGDLELERVLGFYKEYRAMVRAKVACLAAASGDLSSEDAEEKRLEAMRYFHLAAEYGLPPVLVSMCGLPASGKSWTARRVARAFDAAWFASDVRRKTLAGMAPAESAAASYGEGLYRPQMRARTYDSLLESAAQSLADGRSVVLDATFGLASQRAEAAALAERCGVAFVLLHVRASDDAIRERLAARAGDAREASDAGWEVYERAREELELPDEIPAARRVEARSGEEPLEDVVARVISARLAAAR